MASYFLKRIPLADFWLERLGFLEANYQTYCKGSFDYVIDMLKAIVSRSVLWNRLLKRHSKT